jgi:hypothetical protein
LQELEPSHAEALEDMSTITQLLQQQTSQLIGIPGLAIATDPGALRCRGAMSCICCGSVIRLDE